MPAPLLPVQAGADNSNADFYRPGQSLREFHLSPVKIRGLVGGRGSGKTTTVAMEAVGHAMHNAGAKIYVLRKTQESNQDTTLDSFEQVFWNLGPLYQDTGQSLFRKIDGGKTFRLPSRMSIELFNDFMSRGRPTKGQILNWLDTVGNRFCSWLQFAGVPTAAVRGSRFRGFECSMLIFVEADQLEREDLDLGVACLRWKGPDASVCDAKGFIRDTCVILDTNPPSPHHWIAQFEKDEAEDKGVRFWHIPTEENRHNLPDGYIEQLAKQYRKNPAMYARMIEGKYAEAFDGQRVFYAFDVEHVREGLPWPKGAYLVRSWDFGTKQATIWSAYWVVYNEVQDQAGRKTLLGTEYWWDLHEFYAEQSDVERQCRNVLEITQSIFPFWNDRDLCSGVRDFCDVAGNQNKDTGSSVRVLRSHQIYPGFKKMGLQESLAIYNRLLQKTDASGHVVYMIDRASCPRLYAASFGGYRYPMAGEPGHGSNEPMKDGYYDHLADASRYGKVNCMHLLVAEYEKTKHAVGALAQKTNVNRKRRWW